ncbi:MAG TPA: hypothetical protein VFH83_07100 [Spirochaetia bacterium]|nr:hypothetical protein [Spirochaetia bacterium]
MFHKKMLAVLLATGLAGTALAGPTSSSPGIVHPTHPSGTPTNNTVALLETTTTAVGEALSSLGIGFDDYQGPPFPTDLSQYVTVFLAMDGGLLEASDIQSLANYVSAGGVLSFIGGSCWQDYVQAMNTYLVQNDLDNYCWATVASTPDVRIVDANNGLAQGLPPTYNFSNASASYYQFRATDPRIFVAADNGDGYHMLFAKRVGNGTFGYCINSPYLSYWSGADLTWLTQVVSNLYLNIGIGPVPTRKVSWGSLKAAFQRAN